MKVLIAANTHGGGCKNERQLLFRRLNPFENYQELLTFFDSTDLRERERKDIVQNIHQRVESRKVLGTAKRQETVKFHPFEQNDCPPKQDGSGARYETTRTPGAFGTAGSELRL